MSYQLKRQHYLSVKKADERESAEQDNHVIYENMRNDYSKSQRRHRDDNAGGQTN